MNLYLHKNKLIYSLSYLLLFLFSFRFLNKNNTFLLLYAGIGILLGILHRKIKLSKEFIILLLYGLSYYCISVYWVGESNLTNFLTVAVGAPLMYLAGQQYMYWTEDKELHYVKINIICSLGMFLFAILSYLKNGVIYNFSYGKDLRQVPDLWIGNASLWQATNINGYCAAAIIMSLVFIFQKKKGILRILSLVILLGSTYLSFITAARTNLFLIFFVIIFYVLLTLVIKSKSKRLIPRKSIMKNVVVIIFFLILTLMVINNLENIMIYLPMEAFLERINNRHLSIKNDGRWEMWTKVISEIPDHFWGNIESVELAHNLYLDVARVSGVIPMIFILIFTIMILITTWKLMYNEQYSKNIRLLNGMMIVSLLITFMIEPVMTAKPFVFIIFCMICGMQRELYIYPNGMNIRF